MSLDPETGRVEGGASFAASFGPGGGLLIKQAGQFLTCDDVYIV